MSRFSPNQPSPQFTSENSADLFVEARLQSQEYSELITKSSRILTILRQRSSSKEAPSNRMLEPLYNRYDEVYAEYVSAIRSNNTPDISQIKELLRFEYTFTKELHVSEETENLSRLIELLPYVSDSDLLCVLLRTIAEKLRDRDYNQHWDRKLLEWQIRLHKYLQALVGFFSQVDFDFLQKNSIEDYLKQTEKPALQVLKHKVQSIAARHEAFYSLSELINKLIEDGKPLSDENLKDLLAKFDDSKKAVGEDSEIYEISAVVALIRLAHAYYNHQDQRIFNVLFVTESLKHAWNSLTTPIFFVDFSKSNHKWIQTIFKCLDALNSKEQKGRLPLELLCLIEDLVPIYKFLLVKSRTNGQSYVDYSLDLIISNAKELSQRKSFCLSTASLLDEAIIEHIHTIKTCMFFSYDKDLFKVYQHLNTFTAESLIANISESTLLLIKNLISEIAASDEQFIDKESQIKSITSIIESNLPAYLKTLKESENGKVSTTCKLFSSDLDTVISFIRYLKESTELNTLLSLDNTEIQKFLETFTSAITDKKTQAALQSSPDLFLKVLQLIIETQLNSKTLPSGLAEGLQLLLKQRQVSPYSMTAVLQSLLDTLFQWDSFLQDPSNLPFLQDSFLYLFEVSSLNVLDSSQAQDLSRFFQLNRSQGASPQNQTKITLLTNIIKHTNDKILQILQQSQDLSKPFEPWTQATLIHLQWTQSILPSLSTLLKAAKFQDEPSQEIEKIAKPLINATIDLFLSSSDVFNFSFFRKHAIIPIEAKTPNFHFVNFTIVFAREEFFARFVKYFADLKFEDHHYEILWDCTGQETKQLSDSHFRFLISQQGLKMFSLLYLFIRLDTFALVANQATGPNATEPVPEESDIKAFQAMLPTLITTINSITKTMNPSMKAAWVFIEELKLVWKGVIGLATYSTKRSVVWDTANKILENLLQGASASEELDKASQFFMINACQTYTFMDAIRQQSEREVIVKTCPDLFAAFDLTNLHTSLERMNALHHCNIFLAKLLKKPDTELASELFGNFKAFYQHLVQAECLEVDTKEILDLLTSIKSSESQQLPAELKEFLSEISSLLLLLLQKPGKKELPSIADYQQAEASLQKATSDLLSSSKEQSVESVNSLSSTYCQVSSLAEALFNSTNIDEKEYIIKDEVLLQTKRSIIHILQLLVKETISVNNPEQETLFLNSFTKLFERVTYDIRASASYHYLQKSKDIKPFIQQVLAFFSELIKLPSTSLVTKVLSQEVLLRNLWLTVYNFVLIDPETSSEILHNGFIEGILTREYSSDINWEASAMGLLVFDVYLKGCLPARNLIELHLKMLFDMKISDKLELTEILTDADFKFLVNYFDQEDVYQVIEKYFNPRADGKELICRVKEKNQHFLQTSWNEQTNEKNSPKLLETVLQNLTPNTKTLLNILAKSLVKNYSFVLSHKENTQKKLTTEIVCYISAIEQKYPYLLPYLLFQKIDSSVVRDSGLPDISPYCKLLKSEQFEVLDFIMRVVLRYEKNNIFPLLRFNTSDFVLVDLTEDKDSVTLNTVIFNRLLVHVNELLDEEIAANKSTPTIESYELIKSIEAFLIWRATENNYFENKGLGVTFVKILDWYGSLDKSRFWFDNVLSFSLDLSDQLVSEDEDIVGERNRFYSELLESFAELELSQQRKDCSLPFSEISEKISKHIEALSNTAEDTKTNPLNLNLLAYVLGKKADTIGLGFPANKETEKELYKVLTNDLAKVMVECSMHLPARTKVQKETSVAVEDIGKEKNLELDLKGESFTKLLKSVPLHSQLNSLLKKFRDTERAVAEDDEDDEDEEEEKEEEEKEEGKENVEQEKKEEEKQEDRQEEGTIEIEIEKEKTTVEQEPKQEEVKDDKTLEEEALYEYTKCVLKGIKAEKIDAECFGKNWYKAHHRLIKNVKEGIESIIVYKRVSIAEEPKEKMSLEVVKKIAPESNALELDYLLMNLKLQMPEYLDEGLSKIAEKAKKHFEKFRDMFDEDEGKANDLIDKYTTNLSPQLPEEEKKEEEKKEEKEDKKEDKKEEKDQEEKPKRRSASKGRSRSRSGSVPRRVRLGSDEWTEDEESVPSEGTPRSGRRGVRVHSRGASRGGRVARVAQVARRRRRDSDESSRSAADLPGSNSCLSDGSGPSSSSSSSSTSSVSRSRSRSRSRSIRRGRRASRSVSRSRSNEEEEEEEQEPPSRFILTNATKFCEEEINYDELMPGKVVKKESEEDAKEKKEEFQAFSKKFRSFIFCEDRQIKNLLELFCIDIDATVLLETEEQIGKLFYTLCVNPWNEVKIFYSAFLLIFTPEIFNKENLSDTSFINLMSDKSTFSLTPPENLYKIFTSNVFYFLHHLITTDLQPKFFYTPLSLARKFIIKPYHVLEKQVAESYVDENNCCMFDLIIALGKVPQLKKEKQLAALHKGIIEKIFKLGTEKEMAGELQLNPKSLETLTEMVEFDTLMEQAKANPKLLNNMTSFIFSKIGQSLNDGNRVIQQVLLEARKARETKETNDQDAKSLLSAALNRLASSENQRMINNIVGKVEKTADNFFTPCFKSAILFWKDDLPDKKLDKETMQSVKSSLKMIKQELENPQLKMFIRSVYEILEISSQIIGKTNLTLDKLEEISGFRTLFVLAVYFYGFIEMGNRFEKDEEPEETTFPLLSKMISKEWTVDSIHDADLNEDLKLSMDQLFVRFGHKYNQALSALCKQLENNYDEEPLLKGIILLLSERYPFLLNLDTQRRLISKMFSQFYFQSNWVSNRHIKINRNNAVSTLAEGCENLDRYDLAKPFKVEFEGESGVDDGGLIREFYDLIVKEFFNPEKGLFKIFQYTDSIQPTIDSILIPNHLKLFELAGIILAKALVGEFILDCSFTKSFLKHLLGHKITIADLEDQHPDLCKNLKWILENPVDDLGTTFTYDSEILGQVVTKELVENGFNILVTEQNKKEYVMKICEQLMTKEIEPQLTAFLKGFRTIIPKRFLAHLSPGDLGLLISGTPTIDLDQMKEYACYQSLPEESVERKWFWEILYDFSQEELASFLFFLSGSVKTPARGWEQKPITIKLLDYTDENNLPIAHTCYYTLDIPRYKSKEIFREKLLLAIFEGKEGFYIV